MMPVYTLKSLGLDFGPLRRRVKTVYISQCYLTALFRTGSKHHFEITQGLPEDAELIAAFPRLDDYVCLCYRSSTFEPIGPSQVIPELVLEAKTIDRPLSAPSAPPQPKIEPCPICESADVVSSADNPEEFTCQNCGWDFQPSIYPESPP